MKIKSLLFIPLFAIIGFACTENAKAQTQVFETTFGLTPPFDQVFANLGYAVRATSDGYLVAGGSGSPNTAIYLNKLDFAANLAWASSIKFKNVSASRAFDMVATADGGYVLAGVCSISTETPAEDMYLVKVNSAGTKQWAYSYGSTVAGNDNAEDGFNVRLCPDGGFIFVGRTESFGYATPCASLCKEDFYIVKTNSDGTLQWNLAWGGTEHDQALSVCVSYNGASQDGYVITGSSVSFPNGSDGTNIALLKIGTDGSFIWSKVYDINHTADASSDGDIAYGVVQTSAGNYVITGETNSTADIFLMSVDINGTWQWGKTYSGGLYNPGLFGTLNVGGYKLIITSDGGFAMAGTTLTNADDVLLIKTTSNGTFSWARSYGSAKAEVANSVQQTTDGGYIITGTARWAPAATDYNYTLLYKTNSAGNTTGACATVTVTPTVTTLTAPTVIVPTYTLTTPAGTQNAPVTTLSNTAPIITSICNAMLPVELISFTAQCSDNNTTLYWSTASELNNNYFSVEKGTEDEGQGATQIQWNEIGRVNGAGNSSTILNYEFVDTELSSQYSPLNTKYYYRLKQTDYNGKYEYSPVASVRFPCQVGGVEVLSNPSTGIFSVTGLASNSEITLFNMLGEKIVERRTDAKFLTIDIADKPKGVYFLKVTSNAIVFTRKIVVQ